MSPDVYFANNWKHPETVLLVLPKLPFVQTYLNASIAMIDRVILNFINQDWDKLIPGKQRIINRTRKYNKATANLPYNKHKWMINNHLR